MSNISVKFEFKLNSTDEILEKRGLESGGRVQQIIDSEVLRRCDPLVPKDTGMLIDSGILSTDIGSGLVRYSTPYAKKQYYEKNFKHSGKRTYKFFEKMKAAQKDEILEIARKEAGGRQ